MLQSNREIQTMPASNETLADAADALCRRVEAELPDVVCSLISVDEEGRLHPVAGPSLPQEMCKAFDGLSVGPMVGACGTAIYTKRSVEAADIATDPRWTHYAALPLKYGLKACWSTPVIGRDGTVFGAFALYYREVRSHTAREAEVVQGCVEFCAEAMERHRDEAAVPECAFAHARRA
ncbi:GAF domain-containing protein [Brevundimonas staleyi]|uniref:GAF domain-containing protein n=1 Tax=Brevundimonas staleyi TaxID=74326 RepID=A0ABW0FX28_9CAUL